MKDGRDFGARDDLASRDVESKERASDEDIPPLFGSRGAAPRGGVESARNVGALDNRGRCRNRTRESKPADRGCGRADLELRRRQWRRRGTWIEPGRR